MGKSLLCFFSALFFVFFFSTSAMADAGQPLTVHLRCEKKPTQAAFTYLNVQGGQPGQYYNNRSLTDNWKTWTFDRFQGMKSMITVRQDDYNWVYCVATNGLSNDYGVPYSDQSGHVIKDVTVDINYNGIYPTCTISGYYQPVPDQPLSIYYVSTPGFVSKTGKYLVDVDNVHALGTPQETHNHHFLPVVKLTTGKQALVVPRSEISGTDVTMIGVRVAGEDKPVICQPYSLGSGVQANVKSVGLLIYKHRKHIWDSHYDYRCKIHPLAFYN